MQKTWDKVGNIAVRARGAWTQDGELWGSFLRLSSNSCSGNLIHFIRDRILRGRQKLQAEHGSRGPRAAAAGAAG